MISLFVWIHETKKANRQKELEEINEIPEEAINWITIIHTRCSNPIFLLFERVSDWNRKDFKLSELVPQMALENDVSDQLH